MGKENEVIIPLKILLEEYDEEKVIALLNSFSCYKNLEVKNFLKNSAILFEKLNKSRTYLIFKRGTTDILAYFTLTISILKIVDDISKKTLKKLDGISKEKREFPIYLIGQLGKNDKFWNEIKGSRILQEAIDTICNANEIVGGRVILIETLNNEKLIKFYEENGFKILQKRLDKKIDKETGKEILIEYVQMYRII
ncbi:MAG: hypothetical protein ABGW92_00615 [Methanocaldococcus sp.]